MTHPTVDSVPDIARGGNLRGASSVNFQSPEAPPRFAPAFTAVPPPAPTGDIRDRDGRKRRVTGLVPAVAGAQFPLILRDKPAERVSPKQMGTIRGELRKAEAVVKRLEIECASATIEHGPNAEATRAKFLEFQGAEAKVGIWRRQLADAESASKGRPTQIRLAIVREPGEVSDALSDEHAPPVVVCMHDGCRGREWESEAAMRSAHPTKAEMDRTMQAHVFAYLSMVPLDATDPDGEKIGYIAPTGRDGTTVQAAVALAEEPEAATVEDVADLKRQLADLQALVESLTKPKK